MEQFHNQWSDIKQKKNQTILFPPPFINNLSPLLHENIPHHILNTTIKEFSIIIDSKDRDVTQYLNPFQYRINIGNQVQQKIMEYIRNEYGDSIKDPITNKPLFKETIVLPSGSIIKDKINWIKYVRLYDVILPRACAINCNLKLDRDRYTIVQIDEFIRNDVLPSKYGTNDNLSNAFGVLYDNVILNDNFYLSASNLSPYVFDEPFKEINSLSISFKDSYGKQLNYPYLKNCHCCNNIESRCTNICCKPVSDITLDGSFSLDFENIKQFYYTLQCVIDVKNSIITGANVELQFNLHEQTLVGIFNDIMVNITYDIKKTLNNTFCGTITGIIEINKTKNNVNGTIEFSLPLKNEITGIIKCSYGCSGKIIIPFTIPLFEDGDVFKISTDVFVHIYPKSIIEPVQILQNCNTFEGTIGKDLIITGKYTDSNYELSISGLVFGLSFNVMIIANIMDCMIGGTITGNYDNNAILCTLCYNSNTNTANITGTIGCKSINIDYKSPCPLTNFHTIYGTLCSNDLTLPFCLNLKNCGYNFPQAEIINIIHNNDDKNFSLYYSEMYKGSNGMIGSYSNNGIMRKPLFININKNETLFGNYSENVLLTVNNNPLIGKVAGLDNIGYTFIGNYKSLTSLRVINDIDHKEYDVNGYMGDNIVLYSPEIVFCLHSNMYSNKTKCCDCIINPKDPKLQNLLQIKIGVVFDNIPLLYNRQT